MIGEHTQLSIEEKLKLEWDIEKYPDGWDIIVKGKVLQIVIGSCNMEKVLIKNLVAIHNESIAITLFNRS